MSNCPFVRCAVGTGTTFTGFETNVTVKVPVTRVVEIDVTVKRLARACTWPGTTTRLLKKCIATPSRFFRARNRPII